MQEVFGKVNPLFQVKDQQKIYQNIIQEVLKDPEIKQFLKEHHSEISPQNLEKSYSALLEFTKERDARKKGLETKAPGMEPLLFVNNGFVEVVYRPTQAFLQERHERELKNRVQAMNMPKNILAARFKDLDLTKEREKIVQASIKFIRQLMTEPTLFHQALYLSGPFGVGKTYILGAIANELAQQGFVSTLVHVPELSIEVKQSIGNNRLQYKLEALKQAPILMLDDIGAEMNSAWFRDEILMPILQYRMSQELPTFFSSNFTIEELETHFKISNKGSIEALKAKRLIERIRYLAHEFVLNGKNRRHH